MEQDFNIIIAKVHELIDFRLDKGISPSELMDNISSDDYIEISAKKIVGGIKCTVCFYDENYFDSTKIKYKYIYTYDEEMVLNEIMLQCKKTERVVWNRQFEEKKIIDKIIKHFDEGNNIRYKKEFINTLPHDLCDLININKSKLLIG